MRGDFLGTFFTAVAEEMGGMKDVFEVGTTIHTESF
jgi:hypothetical protein